MQEKHGSSRLTDKPKGAQQKRRFVRVPFTGQLTYQQMNPQGELLVPCKGRLLDISGGGLCFRSLQPLVPGEPIQVTIPDLPLLDSFQTFATVRRCAIEMKDEEDDPGLSPDKMVHEDGTPDFNQLFSRLEELLEGPRPPQPEAEAEPAGPYYQIACNLDILTPKERDSLVASIFELQRHSIQKINHLARHQLAG